MLDVCFLLEGTYPFVAGGVSTWVHELLSAMRDIRFGIVSISPQPDPTRTIKYEVPPHVLYLKEVYLHDYRLEPHRLRNPLPKDYQQLQSFCESLLEKKEPSFVPFLKQFRGEDYCFDCDNFFTAKEIWDILVTFYEQIEEPPSFLDYFWTWRGTHLPLLQVLQAEIPPAKIYHAVSTGYAGLLGAMAQALYQKKFFITEHGIYTQERMLEISQAHWIYEKEKKNYRAERDLSFFKKWWVELFRIMSRLAYSHADRIFTLFEGNKVRQVLEGADAQKIDIIPNGIKVEEYVGLPRQRKKTPHIGFVGRVVSIKDVKTFIQAACLTLKEMPDAKFYILGPTDEEEDYFEECKMLVEMLHLTNHICFMGRVDLKQYYSFLDLVVLTSLSEAQPFVILEANVVGIPVVASDVGACRELLEGANDPDRALGVSGIVTEVSNPQATAEATLKLLKDPHLYDSCVRAGMERVRRYYDFDDCLSRYLNIYEQNF